MLSGCPYAELLFIYLFFYLFLFSLCVHINKSVVVGHVGTCLQYVEAVTIIPVSCACVSMAVSI